MNDIKNNSSQKKHIVLLIVFVLLATKGLKFVGWGMFPIYSKIRYITLFALPFLALICYHKTKVKNIMLNKKYVQYFIFTCLCTFLIRLAIYGGGYGFGLENNLFVAFVFCLYFIFHYVQITERNIMRSLTVLGIIVFIIQVYQQFIPTTAVFGVYTDEMRERVGVGANYITGMRNGLYRFQIIAQHLPLLLFCYYYSKLVAKIKMKYLFFAIVFAAATYMMLTRMFLFCLGICAFVIYWAQRKQVKSKFQSYVLIAIMVVLLFNYADSLFANLFDSKTSDIDESGAARLVSMPFLLTKAIENPILFFIGHGYPSVLWEWGEKYGYWYNDLGVFGQIYTYGIIWFIVYFCLVYRLLFKMKKRLPVYIRAYVFSLLCICFLMTTYAAGLINTFLWTIILYISDLYLAKSDITENNVI